MNAALSTNREFITHPGSKGDALENAWIEWLRAYLPNRYSVDKAIVIDHEGNTSHQMDIVIYDNWFTPFIFTQNGFHYIPAEGVYAVFEVKPDIKGNVDDQTYIEYAANKIESVRKLHRTSTDMINSGKKFPPRPLTKILGGILCSTNTYTHKNNDTIQEHIKKQIGLKSIDLGCIADYGSFFVDYEPNEEIMETGQEKYLEFYAARNFNEIRFSKQENSLVTFFMQLTRYLQQAIGTVPAINLQSYLDKIDEEIDKEI
ncbi:DUF6602 domain-containing protein [Fluviicola taffensis]|nr:DUF6602 domain-containing protein [Fluviicola taffensis]